MPHHNKPHLAKKPNNLLTMGTMEKTNKRILIADVGD